MDIGTGAVSSELLSQCLLVGLLPDNMANALGLFSLFLLCVTWNALVIPFAYELSRDPFPGVSRFHPSLVACRQLKPVQLPLSS